MNNPDKCTLFPDGDWASCCARHDEAYRLGGTRHARANADYELFCCVFDAGHPIIAIFMYWGVRIFGGPFWPHRLRWGRGQKWSQTYNYAKSTDKFFERMANDIRNCESPDTVLTRILKSCPRQGGDSTNI